MKLNQLERFAEAALTGALASPHFVAALKCAEGDRLDQTLARQCYEIAEAMMVEARKREQPFDRQSEHDE